MHSLHIITFTIIRSLFLPLLSFNCETMNGLNFAFFCVNVKMYAKRATKKNHTRFKREKTGNKTKTRT